ncbi:unnamed protein product [Colias eurytheme]|nr:unnamed protein product [Colias eurytheme]
MPKGNNSNTPIRQLQYEPSEMNVTMRRKPNNNSPMNSQSSETMSNLSVDDITGNTLTNNESVCLSPTQALKSSENIQLLEKFSQLLDTKLDNVKTSILQTVENTIRIEIATAMQKFQVDLDKRTNNLILEQNSLKENIQILDNKIEKLEQQLYNLTNSKK